MPDFFWAFKSPEQKMLDMQKILDPKFDDLDVARGVVNAKGAASGIIVETGAASKQANQDSMKQVGQTIRAGADAFKTQLSIDKSAAWMVKAVDQYRQKNPDITPYQALWNICGEDFANRFAEHYAKQANLGPGYQRPVEVAANNPRFGGPGGA